LSHEEQRKKVAIPFEQLEGKYEILEKIREGGMGSVYKVRHRLLDEVRVIKVMRPHLADDEVLRARFLREAKVAIRLRHRNLAQIYDFTMDDTGYAYLVMEYIDGLNLQEIGKVLDPPFIGLALEIARQSLDALGYLHRKRIIHRDVSPDNILVTRDDEGALLVKLIDLGIAKISEGDEHLTSAGTFLGKVRYSSPEHFRTHEGPEVTPRSDIYSFGVVLYELLTGTYPIKGTSIASLIAGHMVHPPLDFADSDPDGTLPEALRANVFKALQKKPEDRFPTAKAFLEALVPLAGDYPMEDDQLRAIFEIPSLATRKIETVKPGSSQSRIDQSFGISTTPVPGERPGTEPNFETSGTIETGETPPPDSGGSGEARQAQLRALLLGAGKLVEAHHYNEARLQLAAVLDIDPGNDEATALLEAVNAADVKLQQRLKEIEDAASAVSNHIGKRDADEAERALILAHKLFGNEQAFEGLSDEIEELRHRLLTEKVDQLLTQARAHMESSEFAGAITALEEAHSLAPDEDETADLLVAAREGLRLQEEARRRQAAIDDATHKVNRLILAGRLESALRAIETAEEELGEFDEASKLQARVENDMSSMERLGDQARSAIEKAGALASDDLFADAQTALDEARVLEEDYPEITEMIARAQRVIRKKIEDHRRGLAVAEVTQSVERHIDDRDLDEARRELKVAERLYGSVDALSELSDRIDKCEREVRREEIEDLLHRALEKDRPFEEIIADLESLMERDPGNPKVLRILAETRTAQQRIQEERRAEQIEGAMVEIDRLIGAGKPEEALAGLEEVVARLGDFREAQSLRRLLLGRKDNNH